MAVIENASPVSRSQPRPAGMSIEQARATLWPFRSYRGQPIGTLLDTHQIVLRDLAYAVEMAWDPRVREAARVLLLQHMGKVDTQAEKIPGFVHVVSAGKSFMQKRELLYFMAVGLVTGSLLTTGVIWILSTLWNTLTSSHTEAIERIAPVLSQPPQVVIPAIIVVVVIYATGIWLCMRLLGFGLDKLYAWFAGKIEMHRKGQEGEDRVVQIIQASLDGRWHLFRNVELPVQGKGDLDAVLVGPGGVWVLEIKNYSAEHRSIAERWEYRKNGRWFPARKTPSVQAKKNAGRLAAFLKADGIGQWVEPAVVWANPDAALTIENPGVATWRLDQLHGELLTLAHECRLDDEKQERIVEKLTRLCETQRADAQLVDENGRVRKD